MQTQTNQIQTNMMTQEEINTEINYQVETAQSITEEKYNEIMDRAMRGEYVHPAEMEMIQEAM